MAVSVEIRRLIVEARAKGISISDTGKLFDVGEATVKRITRQWRETGKLTPRKPPGRIPILDEAACALMRKWLEEDNDISLGLLAQRLADAGYSVTPQAVFYRLKHIGWSYKKKCASE